MEKKQIAQVPLTPEQCTLVRENLGLVAVHLRRYVPGLSKSRRHREWDDLFQEGCLGLIAAARRFRPERGIPFAAFALPRIHNAVTRALQRNFSIIRVPPRCAHGSGSSATGRGRDALASPRVRSLTGAKQLKVVAHRSSSPHDPSVETIGERLRDKYERAVRTAGAELAAAASKRTDRAKLIGILAEERFLIPQEDQRRPLRRIADDTKSSCTRVVHCEKQLSASLRRILEADPEFRELRRRARTHPLGVNRPLDEAVERALVSASADEFVNRFRRADSDGRARTLHAVLEASLADVEALVRKQFSGLNERVRERLLLDTDEPRQRRRKSRHDPERTGKDRHAADARPGRHG